MAVMRIQRRRFPSMEDNITFHGRLLLPSPEEVRQADRVHQVPAQWRPQPPHLDPSPQGVIRRLHRRALALTERIVAVYAEFGLTEPEFDLLATLRRAG